MSQSPDPPEAGPAASVDPGWYPDPWGIAPWRWWDGHQWTAGLYGPFGEAWPVPAASERAPKGEGIKGGGIAAVGAAFGVVGTVAVAVVFVALSHAQSVQLSDPWYFFGSELALWAGFLGAVIVASVMNGTRSLRRDFGLSWPSPSDAAYGVLGGLVGRCWPVIIVVLSLVGSGASLNTPSGSPRVLGAVPHGTTGWVIDVALTVVGAPIIEELFFRGLVQGAFTRRIGATPAIFVTALVFAVIHVTDEGILAPLVLFPMALVLGYLRHSTGRLAAGMVAHATFNASLFALFLIPAFR